MKDDIAVTVLDGMLGCMVLAAVLIPSTILNGWVTSTLWGWFIQPVFGLRPITLGEAIGLSLFVSLFRAHRFNQSVKKDKRLEESLTMVAEIILNPFLVLAFGYVLHLILKG